MTIRNDASRHLFRPEDNRAPRRVVPRQGQVLLDTDLSHTAELPLYRIERETAETLGPDDRLLVTGRAFEPRKSGQSIEFSRGAAYLAGTRIEIADNVTLGGQPNPVDLQSAPGDTFAYVLKTVERYVDPVEDAAYADKALGDAEAAGRAMQDWQILILPLPDKTQCANLMHTDVWRGMASHSTGRLSVDVAAAATAADPCTILPEGGFSGLENLMYRVEVHGGEPVAEHAPDDGRVYGLKGLKLKVSRRNASTLVRIDEMSGAELRVSPPARDPRTWFAPGTYAEIVTPQDDIDPTAAQAVEGGAGRLFAVTRATEDRVTLAATPADIAATGALGNGDWFLRLWDRMPDGAGVVVVEDIDNDGRSKPLDIGLGLSLTLGGGEDAVFRRGDFWTFTARADGSIDWPEGAFEVPHGPWRKYAPIGIFGSGHPDFKVEDCRIILPTLSDRILAYQGGDGQSLFPETEDRFQPLPGKLRLAVMRGERPVPGARIEWSSVDDFSAGQIEGQGIKPSDPAVTYADEHGRVEVTWSLDIGAAEKPHGLRATLDGGAGPGQSVMFTADVNTAARTLYRNDDAVCPDLKGLRTVQEAIDALCQRAVAAPDLPRVIAVNWPNDGFVTIKDFMADGLRFTFNERLDRNCVEAQYACWVKLVMANDAAQGTGAPPMLEVVMVGELAFLKKKDEETNEKFDRHVLIWRPKADAANLESVMKEAGFEWVAGTNSFRVLVQLDASTIYASDKAGTAPRHMNGSVSTELTGSPARHGFRLDEDGNIAAGDATASCDFKSWFYLTE